MTKAIPIRGEGVKKRMTDKQSSQTSMDEATLKKYKAFVKKAKRFRKGNNDTQADIVTLKYIRDSAISLMPIAISQYKMWKNDRAMISFRNIVSQVHDVLVALRTQEKGQNECDHIINGILTPDLQVLMKRNVATINQIKSHLGGIPEKDRVKIISILDNASVEMGQNFNIVYTMLTGKIKEFLVGS